jgi:restriction system protein
LFDALASLSPRDFEKLIAHLFEKMGFSTRLMQQTRDGGVDIVARRMSQVGSENLAIQCKHYPLGTVGEKYARDLYGVISAEQQFTRGVLVTSGTFSDDCRRFVDGRRIDLFDGAYVLGLVQKYGA